MVTLKGFDTHASQLQRHDKLLKTLSDSIKAFSDDLKKLGVKDKVTGMTYSEFGRRVNDNGSGTDHGMASNHFVFGSQVKGGKIFGGLPDFNNCLLYTSDAADERSSVDLGGRRLIKKKK